MLPRESLMAITRERLYEEVWAEPLIAVAQRYGVLADVLARVCDDLGIPRPPRGHWVQAKAGTAVARPALPPPTAGMDLEWSGQRPTASRQRAAPEASSPSATSVPRHLDSRALHPILVGAEKFFLDSYEPHSYGVGYLRPRKRLLVDIYVTKDTLSRALDDANQFFHFLESRGHRVDIAPTGPTFRRRDVDAREKPPATPTYNSERWQPSRPTVAFIGGVPIGLTLYESNESAEVRSVKGGYVRVSELPVSRSRSDSGYTYTRDMPTGRFVLRAYSAHRLTSWQREWREAKAGDLIAKFDEIAAALEKAARSLPATTRRLEREERVEHERLRREWEAERITSERREDERRRVEARKESREQLLQIIDAWSLARRIEDFFADAERRGGELTLDGERTELLARLRTARELFGGTDTLRRFETWRSPRDRYPGKRLESAADESTDPAPEDHAPDASKGAQ